MRRGGRTHGPVVCVHMPAFLTCWRRHLRPRSVRILSMHIFLLLFAHPLSLPQLEDLHFELRELRRALSDPTSRLRHADVPVQVRAPHALCTRTMHSHRGRLVLLALNSMWWFLWCGRQQPGLMSYWRLVGECSCCVVHVLHTQYRTFLPFSKLRSHSTSFSDRVCPSVRLYSWRMVTGAAGVCRHRGDPV